MEGHWNQKIMIIAIILVIIGAINWGVIGVFSVNPVGWLNQKTFKSVAFERIIYALVGLAGLYVLFNIKTIYNAF